MHRLIKIDKIAPKASKDIKKSIIGLGFEKLDRDVFDPENPMILLQSRGLSGQDCNQAGKEPKKRKEFTTLSGLTKLLIKCSK